MAKLTSFKTLHSRVRDDGEGQMRVTITHTSDGLPCLDIEIEAVRFGITGDWSEMVRAKRVHRVFLSPEETERVARVIYRSGANGMNQLRAKYEPAMEG